MMDLGLGLTVEVCEDQSVQSVEEENIAHQSSNTNPVPIIFWENSAVYQNLLPECSSTIFNWLITSKTNTTHFVI